MVDLPLAPVRPEAERLAREHHEARSLDGAERRGGLLDSWDACAPVYRDADVARTLLLSALRSEVSR